MKKEQKTNKELLLKRFSDAGLTLKFGSVNRSERKIFGCRVERKVGGNLRNEWFVMQVGDAHNEILVVDVDTLPPYHRGGRRVSSTSRVDPQVECEVAPFVVWRFALQKPVWTIATLWCIAGTFRPIPVIRMRELVRQRLVFVITPRMRPSGQTQSSAGLDLDLLEQSRIMTPGKRE